MTREAPLKSKGGHPRRRKTPDRRRHPTRWWDSILGRKQRFRGRRKGESRNIYVDIYQNADLIIILTIFVLNLLDAYFTLNHIQEGGGELNPLMAQLLHYGSDVFVYAKCFVVALCLFALVAHVTYPIARIGMYCMLGAYGALTAYHVYLQIQSHLWPGL